MTKYVRDTKADRLLPLDRQVSRIARSLASSSFAKIPANGHAGEFEIHPTTVLEIIRARRARAIYFPGELFSDSAWDILLELLHAETARRRITVSALSEESGVPAATLSRWLNALADKGLVVFGRESSTVKLSTNASEAFRHYFRDIFQPG